MRIVGVIMLLLPIIIFLGLLAYQAFIQDDENARETLFGVMTVIGPIVVLILSGVYVKIALDLITGN